MPYMHTHTHSHKVKVGQPYEFLSKVSIFFVRNRNCQVFHTTYTLTVLPVPAITHWHISRECHPEMPDIRRLFDARCTPV